MRTRSSMLVFVASAVLLACSTPVMADDFHFTTGSPDGLIATASRPAGPGIEIETGDDFLLSQETVLTSGSFTGLLPTRTDASNIQNVVIEFYRVFPLDSTTPPSNHVPTRNNSPSDLAFATRDAQLGGLSFSVSSLGSFTVANSVINGINPFPNQFTGGEGAISGAETEFTFDFLVPLDLAAGRYFFVPQVQLLNGDFLWLSAPHPVGPGTDLQTWIRNDNLSPDWLRVGTDITQQGPFNAAFSLNGSSVPEPASWLMMLFGFCTLGSVLRRGRKSRMTRYARAALARSMT